MYDRYTGRKGVALEDLMDEDWKTALALHKGDVPKGAEVYIQKMIQNLYGCYLVVKYNNSVYYVKPEGIKLI